MARLIAILAGIAVVGLVAMMYFVTAGPKSDDQFAECRTTQVAGGTSALGGPFTLVSEMGETVTDADVIDEPTLLYFGYTFCPDVCSIDAARNAVVSDILEEEGVRLKPVFISIDPQRDTPEVMAEYTDVMHPRMLGLTGSDEQVKAASQAYRTYYKAHESEDEFYLVDHSTFSYLTLPEHGFVEFFRRDIGPEAMADQIACFVNAA